MTSRPAAGETALTDSWYLYLVRCRDDSLYTGIATDVGRRLLEHAGDGGRGAKYLRGRGPLRLELAVRIGPRSMALRVERRVKRLTHSRKEALVASAAQVADLLAAVAKTA